MHTITGTVIHHKGRGKTLGFPTANLDVSTTHPTGVYVGVAHVHNHPYGALIFIGSAQTFNEPEQLVEIYILDFSGNVYGKKLTVELHHKLRDVMKFSVVEELITQMRQDEQAGRTWLDTHDIMKA